MVGNTTRLGIISHFHKIALLILLVGDIAKKKPWLGESNGGISTCNTKAKRKKNILLIIRDEISDNFLNFLT